MHYHNDELSKWPCTSLHCFFCNCFTPLVDRIISPDHCTDVAIGCQVTRVPCRSHCSRVQPYTAIRKMLLLVPDLRRRHTSPLTQLHAVTGRCISMPLPPNATVTIRCRCHNLLRQSPFDTTVAFDSYPRHSGDRD